MGRRITIRWTSDRSWHSGTVVAYENGENQSNCPMLPSLRRLSHCIYFDLGHHEILYDSGTSSIVDLVRCQLQFL